MLVLAYCPACEQCHTVNGDDLVFGCRCQCGAFLEEFYRNPPRAKPRQRRLKNRQLLILLIGTLGFIGMALCVPFQSIEREYWIVGVRETEIGSLNILSEKPRAVRIGPVEYRWIWSERPRMIAMGRRPTDSECHVVWQRLALQAAVWSGLVVAAMVFCRRQDCPRTTAS